MARTTLLVHRAEVREPLLGKETGGSVGRNLIGSLV